MPELRAKMPGLLDALTRHGIECLVFLQGLDKNEVTALASSLAAAGDTLEPALARERITHALGHVLVRFISLRELERSD